MREVTKLMINEYAIKKLKYDFAGYKFSNVNELSFHHLIIPKRESKQSGIGDGYVKWNGAILVQETSHDYLHLIESIDRDLFLEITKKLVEENRLGHLSINNIKRIHKMLEYFESVHGKDTNKKGKRLIKRQYVENRIKF